VIAYLVVADHKLVCTAVQKVQKDKEYGFLT
jgi:hypothetical protein